MHCFSKVEYTTSILRVFYMTVLYTLLSLSILSSLFSNQPVTCSVRSWWTLKTGFTTSRGSSTHYRSDMTQSASRSQPGTSQESRYRGIQPPTSRNVKQLSLLIKNFVSLSSSIILNAPMGRSIMGPMVRWLCFLSGAPARHRPVQEVYPHAEPQICQPNRFRAPK